LPRLQNRPSKDAYRDAYRDAISTIICRIQRMHQLNDRSLAAKLSCSCGTIRNARNSTSNLDPVILVQIEQLYGPGAIDPFFALAGVRAFPLHPAEDVEHPEVALAKAVFSIVETRSHCHRLTPHKISGILSELLTARSVLDAVIQIVEPNPL
jgi:hypothetical protein